MVLTQEIQMAAQSFGQSLKNNPDVQAYLELKKQTDADPQVVALEQRMQTLYEDLFNREQAGESVISLASDEYFTLRKQARYHPLLSARENQLSLVQSAFFAAGNEITNILGVEYTSLVQFSPKKCG